MVERRRFYIGLGDSVLPNTLSTLAVILVGVSPRRFGVDGPEVNSLSRLAEFRDSSSSDISTSDPSNVSSNPCELTAAA